MRLSTVMPFAIGVVLGVILLLFSVTYLSSRKIFKPPHYRTLPVAGKDVGNDVRGRRASETGRRESRE